MWLVTWYDIMINEWCVVNFTSKNLACNFYEECLADDEISQVTLSEVIR